MSRRARLWLLVAVALVFVLSGCRRERVVATLNGFSGQVQRDHVAAVNAWETAPVGSKFAIGEAVKTAPKSSAQLRIYDKAELSLEPSTVLRFLDHASDPSRARVALELGQATLSATDGVVEIETAVGTARVASHGQVRLSRDGDATRLEVTIGSAEVLKNGQRFELSVGDAVDVRFEQPQRANAAASATPPAPRVEAPAPIPGGSRTPEPADSAAAEGAEAGGIAAMPRGPDRVDIILGAGDSLAVHDPRPPTAVGVLTHGRCPGSALLRVDGGKTRAQGSVGEAQVAILLGPGNHRYVMNCLDPNGLRGEKIGEGFVTVVADAGSRQLAKTAPATDVETDGRRYTVLYQSLLPRISVRWPNAPVAQSYSLHVTSPKGAKQLSSKGASYAFAPGALGEGDHTLVFEGGGARSRPTTVAIRFDNAAPTASISSPADGSFGPGQSVLVAGTALPGFTVSVGSETLPQDNQNRFSATITAPGGVGALAIRFAQPQRGVHYYLRRFAH
ncbi:MAG TPA: FecR domain-containing protein [Polyangiaceae bacterium]|nr:FecR domain-containing protein [Polyangiaceae bacterium]